MIIMNFVKWSEDFSQSTVWGQVDSLVVNGATSPIGDMTADKVVDLNANNNFFVQSVIKEVLANQTWTFSVWAKLTGSNQGDAQVEMKLIRGVSGTFEQANEIKTLTSSWQRISVTKTWTDLHGGMVLAVERAAGSPTEVHIWGAQLEEASVPGTYIKTESSIAIPAHVLTGTPAQINVSLANLKYMPNTGHEGTDVLKVSSTDALGHQSFLDMPIYVK